MLSNGSSVRRQTSSGRSCRKCRIRAPYSPNKCEQTTLRHRQVRSSDLRSAGPGERSNPKTTLSIVVGGRETTRTYMLILDVRNGIRAIWLHARGSNRRPAVLRHTVSKRQVEEVGVITSSKYIFLPSPCSMNQSISFVTSGQESFAMTAKINSYSHLKENATHRLKLPVRKMATYGC